MPDRALIDAVQTVPPGRWAVGVSGGADSVALAALLRQRGDLSLHLVHLDHQTRGDESAADAEFVRELAAKWNLPCTIARRDQIEPAAKDLPANPSARFRKLRLGFFRQVVLEHRLDGVILAHHADDQAETVLHRLLRSSGPMGLAGMSPRTMIGDLLVLRPMLSVRRDQLRQFLNQINQRWRTDASNESPAYLRNRLRAILAEHPMLFDPLIELSGSCAGLRDWVRANAPVLQARFRMDELSKLPMILARESARRWLAERGVPADQIEPAVIDRLLAMAGDAATPAQQAFPGPVQVRRRRGEIFLDQQDQS